MKKTSTILFTILISLSAVAQINFNEFFEAKTLRLDYIHAGTSNNSVMYFEQFKEEPHWGGSKTKLVDPFRYGDYMLEVYDVKSNVLIYSRGYSTLFKEWQTTDEATKMRRSFYETVVMPYPKNEIRIEIGKRNKLNGFVNKFSMTLKPSNYFIKEENLPNFKHWEVVNNGDPSQKLDIVFLAEGYTAKEMGKFRKDAKRFANYLKNCSPYREQLDKINVWAVASVSEETGVDIPGHDVWVKSAFNSNFYTFNSERYLTTTDIESVRDAAALVPYDQIYILANSAKYGGGGIYNHYSLCTVDNEQSEFVFTHELGHAFADLADEYYDSSTSYNNFFDIETEPYRPNITTLVNFESKWKHMLPEGTPVPTPATEEYKGKVGVFEGGGYVAKGVYRPYLNCSMKDIILDNFCPVCQKAIVDMIGIYSE